MESANDNDDTGVICSKGYYLASPSWDSGSAPMGKFVGDYVFIESCYQACLNNYGLFKCATTTTAAGR
ncbi:unnamed protein product, partial [Mesorhabditis spiculigera]